MAISGIYDKVIIKFKITIMKFKHSNVHISKFISNVCKGRNIEELKEAEDNFTKYLELVKEICERQSSESYFDDSD